jgi:hypothetical protein
VAGDAAELAANEVAVALGKAAKGIIEQHRTNDANVLSQFGAEQSAEIGVPGGGFALPGEMPPGKNLPVQDKGTA